MRSAILACFASALCFDNPALAQNAARQNVAGCTNAQLEKRLLCRDGSLTGSAGEVLVEQAFRHEDFVELDRLYDTWSKGVDRFPDGRWKLTAFRSALSTLVNSQDEWNQHGTVLQSWQAARPKSMAAKMSEALYWRDFAWQARGNGLARDVKGDSWALFDARLEKAEALLRELEPRADACPDWYVLRINVLVDRGKRGTIRVHDVFLDGVRRFPEYHDIYFAAARSYEPRWNGSAAEYDAFANEAAGIAAQFEGVGLYARIYSRVDEANRMPFDPARSSVPSWARLRDGYDALVRRYPSSSWLLSQYASVACRADAGDVYRRVRERIGPHIEHEAFSVTGVQACDRRHQWSDLLPER